MQVPIRAEGMEQKAVEEDRRSEVLDVFVYGEKRCHVYVTALHDDIRYRQPQEGSHEVARSLADVHQVSRDEQEAGHVEGIHYLLDVGVQLLEPHQVKGDDEQYEDTLQKVEFLDSLLVMIHCAHFHLVTSQPPSSIREYRCPEPMACPATGVRRG